MNDWLPNHTEHKHTAFTDAVLQLTVSLHLKSLFVFFFIYCFEQSSFILVSLRTAAMLCVSKEMSFR